MISSLLLEAALRSVVLALAVWTGLRVFNVRNVLAQKAAWGLVLVSALAMPLLLPMASHWNVLPANVKVQLPADPENLLEELQARIRVKNTPALNPSTAAADKETSTQLAEPVGPVVGEADGNRATAPVEQQVSSAATTEYVLPESAPQRATVPQQHAGSSLLSGIILLYLAIADVLLIRLSCGFLRALRIRDTATPVPVDSVGHFAANLDLRCSSELASPVTIFSSIVIPRDYPNWDSDKLRIVLAHERSHIRQGDFYLQLLAGVYAAAFWISPLGWWLKRKLSDLAEAISDRAGLDEAANCTRYAQVLLEFAAAPRPTLIGVAMARRGSLSRRIERLLNEGSFRQAFAGTRRAFVAVLLVPVALFAATVLVRVQAAGQQTPAQPVAPTALMSAPSPAVSLAPSNEGASAPQQISDEPAPSSAASDRSGQSAGPVLTTEPPRKQGALGVMLIAPSAPAPSTPGVGPSILTIGPRSGSNDPELFAPRAPLAARPPVVVLPSGPVMALVGPGNGHGAGNGYLQGQSQSATSESSAESYSNKGKHSGYHWYSSNGDSYAVVKGDDSDHMSFNGEIHTSEIDKARKQAKGDFLWFARDGKAYFVDDPLTMAQIEAMYKPMEELGRQQEELGRKQEALGKQQEELGRQQERASVPTPDMRKEIAAIDEAMAKLRASQGKDMTQEQFGEIQEKLGELQGKLGEIQGQIGSKQGEFGARMGELGAKMGELGAQQGALGAKQGQLAQEADQKVKSIIDESLKNGKAHPVQ